MEIQLGEWRIRSFQEADLDALVRYANNERVSANLMDRFPYPYTQQDGREWLELACHQAEELTFAIASDRELVGGIGLERGADVRSTGASVGYWLGEPFWGRGIASVAVEAFSEWAFDVLGLLRLEAEVYSSNPASGRVLEKAGYQLEGCKRCAVFKRGRVLDALIYGRLSSGVDEAAR